MTLTKEINNSSLNFKKNENANIRPRRMQKSWLILLRRVGCLWSETSRNAKMRKQLVTVFFKKDLC